ncbi:MAG: hypothetical protein Kow0090_14230 [Myxococcota bacterium]
MFYMRRLLIIALASATSTALFACAPEREFGDENDENFPPLVAASVPEYYLVGEKLTIDASNSLDSDGAIVAYYARFGDGSAEDVSPDGIFAHTYQSVGRFTINIEVVDDMGARGSRDYEIDILAVKPESCDGRKPPCSPGRECRDDGYCYTTD